MKLNKHSIIFNNSFLHIESSNNNSNSNGKKKKRGEFTGPRKFCTKEKHFKNGQIDEITLKRKAPFAKPIYWRNKCRKVSLY